MKDENFLIEVNRGRLMELISRVYQNPDFFCAFYDKEKCVFKMCKDCKFKFGKDYDDIPPTLTLIRWLEGDEDKESKKPIGSDQYQALAMRPCAIPYNDRKGMLSHALLGLASEAGEAAGILQKVYQGHPHPLTDEQEQLHLIKELGDCLWMIAEACEAIGTPMSLVMETNIEKLKARYPEGVEADKSLHRKEGDI